MAETQSPTVGYKDQFHLHNGTTLYKLRGVREFDIPEGGAREQEEVTDLDATDWRRQYVSTFYEDSDFEVVVNARPLSDTDVLLAAARDTGDVRQFKVALAENGTLTAQITGTCRCVGYNRGRVVIGARKESVATFRVVSVTSLATYAP